jgi:hypothetical protein
MSRVAETVYDDPSGTTLYRFHGRRTHRVVATGKEDPMVFDAQPSSSCRPSALTLTHAQGPTVRTGRRNLPERHDGVRRLAL